MENPAPINEAGTGATRIFPDGGGNMNGLRL